MTKIKLILNRIKIHEPAMLFWSIMPIVMLIVSTNYVFNSSQKNDINTNQAYESDVNFNDFQNILKEEAIKYKFDQNKGLVSILFLGANTNQFEKGYPILKERGLVGNVSVTTSEISHLENKMTWKDLSLLQNQRWGIVSQSRNQICDKNELNNSSIVESEVQGSKSDLTNNKIYTNTYLAPCGIVNDLVIKSVKSEYSSFITFGSVNNSKSSGKNYNLTARILTNENSKNVYDWIDNVSNSKNWIIIAIPDIEEGDGYKLSENKLLEVVEYLISKDIQFVNVNQILKI